MKAVENRIKGIQRAQASPSSALNGQGGMFLAADKYQRQIAQAKGIQGAFNTMSSMSGQYNARLVESASLTDSFTKKMNSNRLSFLELGRSMKTVNAVVKEQQALLRASSVQWGQTARGMTSSSVLIPKDFIPGDFKSRIKDARVAIGTYSSAVQSASARTGEWARGMQRTGFQITQGIGVPMMALAAIAGVAYYKVDQQLTGIAKVYDTTAQNINGTLKEQQAQEAELASLRSASLSNAKKVAQAYGSTVQQTLSAEQELAATGLKGNDLLKATTEVQRAAILGQLDQQSALKATISLQSTYADVAKASGDSNKWLADQFNFMNQVENQTSLTMADMVDAFPKILPVIKTLGGSVQDAGVLLAGFKERGIDAVEGANGLRTGLTRLLRPTKVVQGVFKDLNVEIEDIPQKSGGDIIKMMELLEERTKGLDKVSKAKAFSTLFGANQAARMTALVESMKGIHDTTTQVGRAFEAANQSTEKWGKTADTEMTRLQNSASQKMKRTIAVIQGELADFGQFVLPIATTVLGYISKIVGAINDLPSGVKKALVVGTLFTVLAGGAFLIIGAFANLAVSITGAAAGLLKFAVGFRMLSAQEIASRNATAEATQAINSQSAALGTVTGRLQAYTAAARQAMAQQMGLGGNVAGANTAMNAVPRYAGQTMPASTALIQGPQMANGAGLNGGYMMNGALYTSSTNANGKTSYRANGRFTNEAAYRAAEQPSREAAARAAEMARSTEAMAKNTQVAKLSMTGMVGTAASLAMLVPIIHSFSNGTGTSATNFAMMGATALMLLPTVTAIAKQIKLVGGIGLAQGWGKAAASIASMVGPAGLAGIAIAGIAVSLGLIIHHLGETRRQMDAVANSGKTWSEVLGYVSNQTDTAAAKQGKTIDSITQSTNDLKSSSKELYNYLKDVSSAQDAIAKARQQGISVSASGGDAQAVEKAMRTALQIGGVTGEAQEQAINIKLRPVIDHPEQVQAQIVSEVNDLMSQAINKAGDVPWYTKLLEHGDYIKTISGSATKIADTAASQFLSAFKAAGDSQQQSAAFKGFVDSWNKSSEAAFNQLDKKNSALFNKLGINNATDLSKQIRLAQELMRINPSAEAKAGGNDMIQARIKLLKEAGTSSSNLTQTEKAMAQQIARNSGLNKDQASSISTLDQLWKALGLSVNAATSSVHKGADGFGVLADKADTAADAIENLNGITADQAVNALKSTSSGIMDSIFTQFANARQQQQEAAINALQNAGQARLDRLDAEGERKQAEFDNAQEASDNAFKARQKALDAQNKQEQKQFDNQWDAIMKAHDKAWDERKKQTEDSYDARIKAVEDEIDAEQKAEDIRQRIFDAEQARIQRAAQMYNSNIDFNAALNSGNLDEAAKLSNDSRAQSLSWANEDSQSVAGDSAKARQDALSAQKDSIEQQKQASLDALDELEKAEQDHLEQDKQMAADALAARQDMLNDQLSSEKDAHDKSLKMEEERYQKSLDAQKKQLQTQNQNAQDSANKQNEIQNVALEARLNAIKAYTPRNKAEMDVQIGQVRQAYSDFGTSYLDPTSKAWGRLLGDATSNAVTSAANALKNDINWADLSKSISDSMSGVLGLNTDQLISWLKTGNFPGASTSPAASMGISTATSAGGQAWKTSGGSSGPGYMFGSVNHAGGSPNWSSADRVGIPRTAGLYPSEVPAILKRGEFVVNERGYRENAPLLHAMNSGNSVVRHSGGAVNMGGLAASSLIGTAVAKAIAQGIAGQLAKNVGSMLSTSYGTAAAGKYGNTKLNEEQVNNASIIMNVGKSMGASQRDLIVALMTAMQESRLRNLSSGDRDSVGLFQQRGNGAWGTLSDRMNPQTSARMFFDALFKVKGRDSMSLTQEAQKVQRSAFPNAYAQWEALATSLVSGTPATVVPFAEPGANAAGVSPVSGSQTYGQIEQLANRGPAHRVTSTTGGGHAAGSYHYKGQAIDEAGIRPGVNTPELLAINQFWANNFGKALAELIYGGPGGINIKNGQLHKYSASTLAQHQNHVHVAMTPQGLSKLGIPSMRVGGEVLFDDTLANLHKGEKVLTAPLTSKLDKGIDRLANGDTNSQININLNGVTIREEADIDKLAKAVVGAMDQRERRNGRSKRMGN